MRPGSGVSGPACYARCRSDALWGSGLMVSIASRAHALKSPPPPQLAASNGAASGAMAAESAFLGLHVRRTRELVTLGPRAAAPLAAARELAARHVTPVRARHPLALACVRPPKP